MNKALLTGRVTKDPMITDKVARFTLAVDRRYKKEGEPTADFISCVGFGKTRDFIEKYVTKGTKYGIVGRIQTGSYEKDGQKIYTTDVIIDEIEFGESKKQDKPADDFVDVPDEIESELPFN
jgi:single-strand DNA-binding protein